MVTLMVLRGFSRCYTDAISIIGRWVKRSGPIGAPLEASRDRVLAIIERMTGMELDVVCSASAKGGENFRVF